jgi:hypothetical protein
MMMKYLRNTALWTGLATMGAMQAVHSNWQVAKQMADTMATDVLVSRAPIVFDPNAVDEYERSQSRRLAGAFSEGAIGIAEGLFGWYGAAILEERKKRRSLLAKNNAGDRSR